jgi:two-component system, cell cycle sensor histidine kinase DivJ
LGFWPQLEPHAIAEGLKGKLSLRLRKASWQRLIERKWPYAKAGPVALQALWLTFFAAGCTAVLSSGVFHQTSSLWFAIAAGLAAIHILGRGPRHLLTETDKRNADTMGCVAACFGLSGQALSVTSNCESLFGVTASELMGCGFFERVQVADRPTFLKAISDACAQPVMATTTLRWRGLERVEPAGQASPVFHWLEMRARRTEAAPRKNRQDANVVAFFRDVTEAKCRDAELEDARAHILAANSTREHFFTHAGHEIRSPLNSIAGFAELLASSSMPLPVAEKQREYARIIQQSAQHLLTIADSITDLSLIQSGRLPVTLVRFAAAPQIDLCCDMLALQAKNNGVLLLRAYPANLDAILCDKRLFTQILVNLVSNSIKFTPANGRVTVAACAEGASLLINVTDTGIGIDEQDLGRLGDPFFQAKSVPDRQGKGTGLGLSIVRGFVGMLGGEIMVASEPEKGTCVSVRLPLEGQVCTGAAKGPAKIATLAGLPPAVKSSANQQIMVKKIA